VRPELQRIQEWMQGAIVAEAEPDRAAVRRRILPSRTLRPEERLDIYRGMYEARLQDALASDYPGLQEFLGEEVFAELVHLYIQAHPSRSYTLNRLGDRLPQFVREVEGLPEPLFVADLARYELLQTAVFDEAETSPLTPERIAAVPAEAWMDARLRTVAAFRMGEFGYPVHKYMEAVHEARRTATPRPRAVNLALFRRDYALAHFELGATAYRVLASLAGGETLGAAIENNRARPADLRRWFQQWTSHGLFQAVDY
jgi:hypothetical protein